MQSRLRSRIKKKVAGKGVELRGSSLGDNSKVVDIKVCYACQLGFHKRMFSGGNAEKLYSSN